MSKKHEKELKERIEYIKILLKDDIWEVKEKVENLIAQFGDHNWKISNLQKLIPEMGNGHNGLQAQINDIRDNVQAGFEKLQTGRGDGHADIDDLKRKIDRNIADVYKEIAKMSTLHENEYHGEGDSEFDFDPVEEEKVANLLKAKKLLTAKKQYSREKYAQALSSDEVKIIYDALEYAETLIK